MSRIALLFCLLLALGIARPIQIQAQTTNPTASSCGLPLGQSNFTSAATVTTFTLSADCTLTHTGATPAYNFQSGTFTINGNGNGIILSNATYLMDITGSSAVVNLNNIIILSANETSAQIIRLRGRLNATDVTFRNNTIPRVVSILSGGRADLSRVRFQNNSRIASNNSQMIETSGTLNVTNAIFTGNRGYGRLIRIYSGTTTLAGCVTNSDNRVTSSGGLINLTNGTVANNTIGACVGGGFTTATPVTPTATPVTPTATPVTPTATPITPTATPITPTATLVTPTATPVTLTATPITPTAPPAPKKKKKKEPTPVPPTPTATPQIAATHVALQASTGATFRATFGMDSGVHFRQLDGAGIGIQSIIDAGFLEAFDVYGYVEQGVEVCFPQIGRVIFLDANTSPRAIVSLPSIIVNGQTCVSINSPGSLVLLPN